MRNIVKITSCVLLVALYSCNGNKTDDNTKCAYTSANASKTAAALADTMIDGTNDSLNMSLAATENSERESSAAENKNVKSGKKVVVKMPEEPSSGVKLNITSSAFTNNSVIPVKYTCDGEGLTPPLNFGAVPAGTKSYALIIHDYNATPDRGFTYWIIWNLDTAGYLPENFRSSHQSMNAAKQYGYTPICSKAGDHKYHFIVYALDTRMVLGKTTTKAMIESVMKNHILGKGEIVGLYNKRLE